MSLFDFKAKDIDGNTFDFSTLKGKVCLVVNVARRTKRDYEQLVALDNKYKSKGLEILAFPCNQFGGQESGCEADIKKFVQKFNVEFKLFSKVDVNGKMEHEIFTFLKKQSGEGDIPWNFAKFLCNKEGQVVHRENKNGPFDFEDKIVKLL